MTKDEALKMAIDAMETADAIVWEFGGVAYEKLQEALKICKEAVKSHFEIGIKSDLGKDFVYTYRLLPDKDGLYWMLQSDLKKALEQPAQEPVGWNEEEFNEIAYAYRICPAHEVKKVSERYQDLVAYVLALKDKNT